MSNLKQLRGRRKTIKSTQKITKAMQMVSASKLKKIKHQIADSMEYLKVLGNMMTDISSSNILETLPAEQQQFFNNDSSEKADLFIVLTAERGLCGSFNSSIIKTITADIANSEKFGKQIKLIIIGKKGHDLLKNKYSSHIDSHFNLNKEDTQQLILQIKQKIISMVEKEEIGNCYLYFTKFKNAMLQIPVKQCLLPIKKPAIINNHLSHYEYEGKELVPTIIDLYIKGQVHFALLQSRASEEGARMTAMDNATKNAGEMIDKLTLKLNRSRQAIITKELIEIISGAEVV